MYNIVDLTNKKIVITGASSGIGRQVAITVSRLGGKVIAVARREDKLIETISMLEGLGHSYYVCDLSACDKIVELFDRIKNDNGKVDGLVYAAGISKIIPINFLTKERVREVFDTNFNAFIESVRQICKKGRYNDGMSIVVISSVDSVIGSRGNTAYSSSKAAINGAVRCIACELAVKGVRINSVMPGMTDTKMYQDFLENTGGDVSDANNKLLQRQYLGIGKVEDVANVVAFLISPATRFVTGICLPVDGGQTSN